MYALLEQLTLQAAFPLAALCETLEVSRAGYYAWRSESQSAQQERDRELTPLICDIFWKHKRRYGARRIAVELGALGQPCGVDRVAKLHHAHGSSSPSIVYSIRGPGRVKPLIEEAGPWEK